MNFFKFFWPETKPLNSCSNPPTNLSKSEIGCLDKISEYYFIVEFKGAGAFGITIIVDHLKHQLALKILKNNNEGINEVKIACKLNELSDITSIFTHVYGWSMCYGVPKEWNERIPWNYIVDSNEIKRNKNDDFIYLVMEINTITFDSSITFNEDDLFKILFILLHGLIMTRTKYPEFKHFDIHANNIMLQLRTNKKNAVRLDFPKGFIDEREDIVIENVHLFPKIIDFGLAIFDKWDHIQTDWENDFQALDNNNQIINVPRKHDVYRIFYVIYKKLFNLKLLQAADKLSKFMKSADFILLLRYYTEDNDKFIEIGSKILLEHKIFKNLFWKELKQKKKSCWNCSNTMVTCYYEHSKDYQFCSKECADVFSVFKNYFPIKY